MKWLKRLVLMLQFLTAIPIPINLKVTEEDFGKGLVFAPVIGLVLGGILSGTFYLLDFVFPLHVTVVFCLILYILLTGGIHLDGLGDTFDGIFSNRPKERILEIMRDSRVGTNAVLAVVCLLLLNFALLSSMEKGSLMKVLLLMPVAGRIGSLVGAGVSGYARSGQGLGKSFIEHCGICEIAKGAVLFSAIFFIVFASARGIGLCLAPVVTAWLMVRVLGRKIGGATGDILGAVCELNQTMFLITSYLFIEAKMI